MLSRRVRDSTLSSAPWEQQTEGEGVTQVRDQARVAPGSPRLKAEELSVWPAQVVAVSERMPAPSAYPAFCSFLPYANLHFCPCTHPRCSDPGMECHVLSFCRGKPIAQTHAKTNEKYV